MQKRNKFFYKVEGDGYHSTTRRTGVLGAQMSDFTMRSNGDWQVNVYDRKGRCVQTTFRENSRIFRVDHSLQIMTYTHINVVGRKLGAYIPG